ncbi:hypothetical protein BH23BAC3_BH23BAC3_19650 [soil metagenome]
MVKSHKKRKRKETFAKTQFKKMKNLEKQVIKKAKQDNLTKSR